MECINSGADTGVAPAKPEWDIVIAGAGFSGLVAANIVADGGLKALVLEAGSGPGGCAGISAGIVWAPLSSEELAAYVPDGDAALQVAYCKYFDEAVSWLRSCGLPISDSEALGSLGKGVVMQVGRSGDRGQFMWLMASRAEAYGATIQYRSPLMGASARADGYCVAIGGSHPATVQCRALLFATGGFQGNRELLDRFVGAGAGDSLFLRSLPECTGAGLTAALSLGAATSRNMHNLYGHTMPDAAVSADDMQPLTAYLAFHSVILNREGIRFVDETEGHLEETTLESGWRQPGGFYFLIFDSKAYREHGVDTGISSALPKIDRMRRWREIGASVLQGDSLEALLAELDRHEHVNPERALKTLASFNEACLNGTTQALDPPRTRNPSALLEPPFFAVRARGGVTATCGGIRVDASGHVLGDSQDALPGLYAAGVDAGGVFGRTYGGLLGWSLVSGYLAALSVLRDARHGSLPAQPAMKRLEG